MNTPDRAIDVSRISAQVRLKVLEQFVSSLAHDLRTPLTVIRNATYILRRSAAATPDVAECASMIEGEVGELNQMISSLVDLVRPSRLVLDEISLTELLNAAADKVDREKRVNWRFEIEFDPPALRCDRERMANVLFQLFRNAVTATRGTGCVSVRAFRDDRWVTIDVSDDGPGIAEELGETIFEPFTSTRRSGMGLGLTYCREILRRHGGDIVLQPSAQSGAAFRLTIPRAAAT